MKIYAFTPSPNCQKVLAVVRELALSVETVPVDIFRGEAKAPGFLAKNPNGRVPVLEDEGLVLWESNAILAYLASQQPASSLLPTRPRERAEMTIPAANSALHRARVAVEERPVAGRHDVDSELLARYVRAWEAADVEAIVSMLHDEVTATMPPSPTWFAGRRAFEAFFRQVILPRLREEPAKLVRRDANGQAAFGFYRKREGAFRIEAVHLVSALGGQIVSIDHCMMPEIFDVFALSRVLDIR